MATCRRRLRQLSGALSPPASSPRPTQQRPVAAGGSAAEMLVRTEPTPAQRFLFDTQGYLLLPEVLSKAECARIVARLRELEAADYADEWVEELGLERSQVALTKQSGSADYQGSDHQTRLNGLPKIDPTGTFDPLISHPRVLPFLQSFMQEPQLVNIWSISKSREAPRYRCYLGCILLKMAAISLLTGGSGAGGFHAGYDPHDYQVDTRGKVHSKMLNVVWMLTDNGPGDGEMQAASTLSRFDCARGLANQDKIVIQGGNSRVTQGVRSKCPLLSRISLLSPCLTARTPRPPGTFQRRTSSRPRTASASPPTKCRVALPFMRRPAPCWSCPSAPSTAASRKPPRASAQTCTSTMSKRRTST